MNAEEVRRHTIRSNIDVLIGIVLFVAAPIIGGIDDLPEWIYVVLFGMLVFSIAFFVCGCRHYAASKGHRPEMGWWGLLGLLGLIILVAYCSGGGGRQRRV